MLGNVAAVWQQVQDRKLKKKTFIQNFKKNVMLKIPVFFFLKHIYQHLPGNDVNQNENSHLLL